MPLSWLLNVRTTWAPAGTVIVLLSKAMFWAVSETATMLPVGDGLGLAVGDAVGLGLDVGDGLGLGLTVGDGVGVAMVAD